MDADKGLPVHPGDFNIHEQFEPMLSYIILTDIFNKYRNKYACQFGDWEGFSQ